MVCSKIMLGMSSYSARHEVCGKTIRNLALIWVQACSRWARGMWETQLGTSYSAGYKLVPN